jgi:hypothetical protein
VTRSFANTRRVLCAGLLCAAALYFAPPARSQSCASPGNAGVDQYCDPLNPPPGARHGSSVQGSVDASKRTRHALEQGSASARGALALSGIRGVADPIAPARTGAPSASRPQPAGTSSSVPGAGTATSESGPEVGGGFIAAIVALAVAVTVLAWLARRRRTP